MNTGSRPHAPNRIDIGVDFSFKGENYELSSTLELDRLLLKPDLLESEEPFHEILAAEHGIDTYSYLYEVMLVEEIRFGNAHGFAADFLSDGEFDLSGFYAKWEETRVLQSLQTIARDGMNIDDLEQHPQLKNALLRAYRLGIKA